LATEEEIIAIVNQFQSGEAAGYDNIPMSIIKHSVNVISTLFMHIVSLSIMHAYGVFPDKMKIAHVVLIFKCGDKTFFFQIIGLF